MVGDGEERALRSLAKETETKMAKEVLTHQKKISWIDNSALNLVINAAALYWGIKPKFNSLYIY